MAYFEAVGESSNIPLRTRFRAWWRGVDPQDLIKDREVGNDQDENSAALHAVGKSEKTQEYWTADRLDFLTRLWGGADQEEILTPGGLDYTLMLAKPMHLRPTNTVLDLAAGLGGGTRALSKEFELWIEGMEHDEELAAKAHELSVKYGKDRRAPIKSFNPENIGLREARYDAIIMRESMYRYRRKDLVLKQIYDALKPSGHYMVVDLALRTQSSPDQPDLAKWLNLHQQKPLLWSMDEYRRNILNTRMNLHIYEDRTNEYRHHVLTSWTNYIVAITNEDIDLGLMNQIMDESKYWIHLLRAMESGELRFLRIHATKGSETIL